MAKLKEHYQSFLESGGSKLGFSNNFLPELEDIKDILVNGIDAQSYSELKEVSDEQ